MKNTKAWLGAALLIGALIGGARLITTEQPAGAAEEKLVKDHWHHYDGHWSYWHDGDKRWYYTDGTHWYYRDGDAWKVYRFDKQFGRDGFERGEYKAPREEDKVVVPRHGVYRAK